MLMFRPLTQEKDIARIFPEFEEGMAYIAYDGEQEVGSCLFCLLGEYIDILAIHTQKGDSSAVIEGLLRVALGYGSRRGAFRARLLTGIDDFSPEEAGFRAVDERYEAEIYDVLTSGGCARCACSDVGAD